MMNSIQRQRSQDIPTSRFPWKREALQLLFSSIVGMQTACHILGSRISPRKKTMLATAAIPVLSLLSQTQSMQNPFSAHLLPSINDFTLIEHETERDLQVQHTVFDSHLKLSISRMLLSYVMGCTSTLQFMRHSSGLNRQGQLILVGSIIAMLEKDAQFKNTLKDYANKSAVDWIINPSAALFKVCQKAAQKYIQHCKNTIHESRVWIVSGIALSALSFVYGFLRSPPQKSRADKSLA